MTHMLCLLHRELSCTVLSIKDQKQTPYFCVGNMQSSYASYTSLISYESVKFYAHLTVMGITTV